MSLPATTDRIEDFDDDFDPFSAQLMAERVKGDPYGELARLRAAAPVHDVDIRAHFGAPGDPNLAHLKGVTVLGHKEVHEVLNDPQLWSNRVNDLFLGKAFGRAVVTMDAPEHTKYRRLFQRAFLPSMLERYKTDMVPKIVDRLINAFVQQGRAELVSDFTQHFAFSFIHALMELPDEDRRVFQKLAVGQLAVSYDPPHGDEAVRKLTRYITQMVDQRRRQPLSDVDFVHAIATAEIDGEQLPQDIVVGFLRILMNAGGDTSYHGFGNILTGLLTNPEQLEQVRQDRSLIPAAIEEGLRWNGPVMFLFREPTREAQIGGVTVRPGEHYMNVVIGSANRDESMWEQPEVFNIHRKQQRHASFGFGAHVCIGQHLARMEMVLALNALLDRLPNLRLDPQATPPQVKGLVMRGASPIHVLFD
jgi:cytochrome P450